MPLPDVINDREYQKFLNTPADKVSIRVSDDNETLNNGGIVNEVTVNAVTWTALTTSFASRKTVAIQNQSDIEIKINYSASVSGYVGMRILKNGERVYNLSPGIVLYGKSVSDTALVAVEEVG